MKKETTEGLFEIPLKISMDLIELVNKHYEGWEKEVQWAARYKFLDIFISAANAEKDLQCEKAKKKTVQNDEFDRGFQAGEMHTINNSSALHDSYAKGREDERERCAAERLKSWYCCKYQTCDEKDFCDNCLIRKSLLLGSAIRE